MLNMEVLSQELTRQMEEESRSHSFCDRAFDNTQVIRRKCVPSDAPSIWRPTFAHDIDKIMHCPYFNRYADKTQVFSLLRNDDITRRMLHVQLVSRIARTIGRALHLNEDLIEAISLGHDIGHPPFAHTGERYLNDLYHAHTGRFFRHNIHSVRVLDGIFPYNISLQTLDGIAAHNGELQLEVYEPEPIRSFADFDRRMERCYTDETYANRILPTTLEAAVVRMSDIIAYLGKDRQDAARVNIVPEEAFAHTGIGSINAEIINNLVVNLIENSYGKPYIKLDRAHFDALIAAKRENYAKIYGHAADCADLENTIKPMMTEIYGQLLDDLKNDCRSSPVFTHHIAYVNQVHYRRDVPYENSAPNDLVVDYIASMTDNYFVELHHYLFPESPLHVKYLGYFEGPFSPENQEVSPCSKKF